MPRIHLDAGGPQPERAFDAPDGGRLLDLCDEARAMMPTSCRAASCGTCLVEVVSGRDDLMAPGPDEIAELHALGESPPGRRLLCQAVVLPGPGVVRLRVAPRPPPDSSGA